MNEGWFKKKMCKALRERGLIVDQTHTGMKRGVPDLLLCIDGRCVWIELKFLKLTPKPDRTYTLGHPMTAPQSKWLRDWQKHGALCHLVVGFEDLSVVYIDEFEPGPLKKIPTDRIVSLDDYISEGLCNTSAQK